MATFEKANALHIGDLRRYASVLLRSTGEVDDLVQGCLLHVASRRPRGGTSEIRAPIYSQYCTTPSSIHDRLGVGVRLRSGSISSKITC